MILHLLRMRRNVSRDVFNDRKNVSTTTACLKVAGTDRDLSEMMMIVANVGARMSR